MFDAAEEVFGKLGYERAGISEITRTAGVGLGTFYVYFPNKLAIFVELVDELGSRLRTTLRDAVQGETSRLDVERAGLRAFLDFAAQHRHLYRIVRQAEFVDEAVFLRYYQRLGKAYASGLARAVEAGELRPLDPEVMAYALMGMADFLGMRFVLQNTAARREHVVDEVMTMLTEGLAPKGRATRSARASR